MLDLKALKSDPDRYRAALATRKVSDAEFDRLLALRDARNAAQQAAEDVRRERNALNARMNQLRKAGEDPSEVQKQSAALKDRDRELDQAEKEAESALTDAALRIPNVPHPDAPVGDESNNRILADRAWGEPRLKADWDFEPKPHWDVAGDDGLRALSMERGARLAGSSFPLLTGAGARLERALINFMIDLHAEEHGFTEVWPPLLARREVLQGTGQIPKLEDDMYRLERDDLFLIPTAEVQLVNIHREETLKEADLPKRYVGFTSCFRREAGAAGRMTRGLIRVHQFDKVELVAMTTPENSEEELERLLGHASTVLQRLELPYRVVELSTEDLSFASHRTYDLEVYSPGVDDWLEVSSVSNCLDFQARRAGIRYKPAAGKAKSRYVHTLNGSGTALPRVVVSILENFQREDGSVVVPAALRDYIGREVLEKA